MNLIAIHLDKTLLTCKIHQVNTICAYSGKPITEGILFDDIIGERFTEREIFKYQSDYLSINFALMTQPVIKGEKQLNALRNYSFFASEKQFKLLDRNELTELLFNIPETPFQIAITYSNKKHLAYKTPVNYNKDKFIVCTDTGMVEFDVAKAAKIYPILQNWYTIAKQTAQQPTFFTKDDILGLSVPLYAKILEYGIEKYFNEDTQLKPYRNTLLLKLLVHILNKK